MRRAALEKARTIQTWRRHLVTHGSEIACECELQPGRFRKSQRVGGCRRPGCWLCHFDKLSGIPTVRDRRALANEREGIAEVEAEKSSEARSEYKSLFGGCTGVRHWGRRRDRGELLFGKRGQPLRTGRRTWRRPASGCRRSFPLRSFLGKECTPSTLTLRSSRPPPARGHH
jgi:hypothetical protein